MSELEELKKEKERIEQLIQEKEEGEHKKVKKKILEQYYEKIVCLFCNGIGQYWSGGADMISDPPIPYPCDDCQARGWIYARRYDGDIGRGYTVTYDERIST